MLMLHPLYHSSDRFPFDSKSGRITTAECKLINGYIPKERSTTDEIVLIGSPKKYVMQSSRSPIHVSEWVEKKVQQSVSVHARLGPPQCQGRPQRLDRLVNFHGLVQISLHVDDSIGYEQFKELAV